MSRVARDPFHFCQPFKECRRRSNAKIIDAEAQPAARTCLFRYTVFKIRTAQRRLPSFTSTNARATLYMIRDINAVSGELNKLIRAAARGSNVESHRQENWVSASRRSFREIITVLESACTNARAALPYVPIEYNLYSASGRRLHKTTLPLAPTFPLGRSPPSPPIRDGAIHGKQVHAVYAFTYTLQPDRGSAANQTGWAAVSQWNS